MRWRIWMLLPALVACGGSVSPSPPVPELDGLTLEAEEVCIGGDSRTLVSVHLVRGAAPRKDVAVTVDGDPDEMYVEPLVIPADQDDGELRIFTGSAVVAGKVRLHVHAGGRTSSLDVRIGGLIGTVDSSFGDNGTLTLTPADPVLGLGIVRQGTGVVVLNYSTAPRARLTRVDDNGSIDAGWGVKGMVELTGGGQLALGIDQSIWLTHRCNEVPCQVATRISSQGTDVKPIVLPAGPNPAFVSSCIATTTAGTFVGGWLSDRGAVLKIRPDSSIDVPFFGPTDTPEIFACSARSPSEISVGDSQGGVVDIDEYGKGQKSFGPGEPIRHIVYARDRRIYVESQQSVGPSVVALHVYDSTKQVVPEEAATWTVVGHTDMVPARSGGVFVVAPAIFEKRPSAPPRKIASGSRAEVLTTDACGRIVAAYALPDERVVVTRLWP